jgi:hypothetical protein
MSLLAPLRPLLWRTPKHDLPADKAKEWHVGLSIAGMFPHAEASCPCAKAPCGLAIPQVDVYCPAHLGAVPQYRQLHIGAQCAYPRKGWFRRSAVRR